MYPTARSSIETVSDTVSRMYSTGISFPTTLPFPWFMKDGLKSRRVLTPHWMSISISNVAPVRVGHSSWFYDWLIFFPAMRMSDTIATSVNILSVPGNRSSPFPMSMASSTHFFG